MEPRFWLTSRGWRGEKLVDGVLYHLEEVNDRSWGELHSYMWFTKGGARMHLDDGEREQIPDEPSR